MRKKERRPAPTTSSALSWRLSPFDRVLILFVFLLLGLLALREVGSVDIGFHLAAGEHILSGKGWPRTDPFTYTVNDHLYIDTSWGYQVLAASVQAMAGAPGLVLFHAALVLAIFFVVYRTTRLVPADPTSLIALFLLGGLACEMRFVARPELLSYFLLAVTLHLLHRHAEGRVSPLWALPLIHLVWANTHSLFVLGWVALACFQVGLWLRRGSFDRRLAAWSAASVAATIVNPYGWRGVLFPFTLMTRFQGENVFAKAIGEFVSPFDLRLSERYPFYPRVPIVSFQIFLALSALALLLLVRRRRFWCVLLWMAFLPLAYRMIRNLPILVVAALPGTVWALPVGWLLDRWRVGRARRPVARQASLALLALAIVSLGLRIVHDSYYVDSRREERFGLGWNRLQLPVDAAEFVRRTSLPGRVFNQLNLGGYLIWSTDDPVFIDGRLEVMGEEFFSYYLDAMEKEGALEECVARYGIQWMIFPYADFPKILGRVSRDTRWKLAYVDPVAVVFVRNGPDVARWIDPSLGHGSPSVVPFRSLPGLGGRRRRGHLSYWLSAFTRRAEFPWDDLNLGLFHLYRSELGAAEARFERAIARSDGAIPQFYFNLAAVLYRAGRLEEAKECYRIVLEDEPRNRLARERLSERR